MPLQTAREDYYRLFSVKSLHDGPMYSHSSRNPNFAGRCGGQSLSTVIVLWMKSGRHGSMVKLCITAQGSKQARNHRFKWSRSISRLGGERRRIERFASCIMASLLANISLHRNGRLWRNTGRGTARSRNGLRASVCVAGLPLRWLSRSWKQ
jgi:hypothetical protein